MVRSTSNATNGSHNKNNTDDPFNFTETLRAFTNPMDGNVLMQQHRKNIEALTEANTMAAEVMKSISQLQTSFVKQAFDEMATYMRECTHNLQPTDLSKNAEPMRKQADIMAEHSKNIASMLEQSNRGIYDVFHDRFQESVEEMQEAATTARKKH
jgi:hypothetical protein